jgi:hypothetical protein
VLADERAQLTDCLGVSTGAKVCIYPILEND